MSQNQIYQQYLSLKAEFPEKYARDLAALIGIDEAQLCEARIGHDAQALSSDFPALLQALEAAGEIRSITRNEYAVHEQSGVFTNLQPAGHAWIVLNPRDLDLRLLPSAWNSAFALREQSARGERQSLQIFDRYGDAVLKIYTTDHTDMAAWQALLARFVRPAPAPRERLPVPVAEMPRGDAGDGSRLDAEWRVMTDVHQFSGLLKRHNVSRQQAFRAVGDDLARQVSNDALGKILTRVRHDGNEIMIFVSNRGCTQIFTGVIEKLMQKDGWINVFNPDFTLHLMSDRIGESWVTCKPGADGFVTSLELFATDGTQIAQLYGQRTEGEPEQTRWREQISSLTR
ncbi:MAG: ChuX/HutX family heme-like substrate-binding protein [Pantoea sp.]|uniref:hemin-degrading factor n=1 Tax=Pantoea sp. TaxID=69393 RepID=UPI0039E3A6AC